MYVSCRVLFNACFKYITSKYIVIEAYLKKGIHVMFSSANDTSLSTSSV